MKTHRKITKTDSPHSDQELREKDISFNYWGTMNYLIGLIKSSELKAGLILSFFGIIFNFIYQNAENMKDNFEGFSHFHILAGLWLVCTLTSMFYSVRSFIPRIEKNYEPNIFFFGDIVSKYGDIKEFSQTFLDTSIDKAKLYEQLGQQIYINAKITTAKFKNVNKSLKYLVFSIIILIVFLIDSAINTIFF